MNPIFVVTHPRARGSLLTRILGRSRHFAGDAGALLQQLRLGGGDACRALAGWAGDPTAPLVVRDHSAGQKWDDQVAHWSWILLTWPEAKIVFLKRNLEETEISLFPTISLWVPDYGTCYGCCFTRIKETQRGMEDFHEMNPTRTVLMDSAELLEWERFAGALASSGIEVAGDDWQAEVAKAEGGWREIAPALQARAATVVASAAAPSAVIDPDGEECLWDDEAVPRRMVPGRIGDRCKVVIPLHPGGGKYGNDGELRMMLRSLERHLREPFDVVVVGPRVPDWSTGIEHLPQHRGGLKSAIRQAAAAFPHGFFLMYDDTCLLQDATAAEMQVTPVTPGPRSPRSRWAEMLEEVLDRLRREGHVPRDYSRPHGPYWFDKSMIDEAFADWPGMAGKFPFESWILSKRDWPRTSGVTAQYYGRFTLPPASARYINYNDDGNTKDLRDWLAARFPNPSRFEKS